MNKKGFSPIHIVLLVLLLMVGLVFFRIASRKGILPTAEIVKPALRDEKWQGARCNDGTPFGFILGLSPSGQSKDWVIHLQGGGFCDDDANSCIERKNSETTKLLTTTYPKKDGENIPFAKRKGIFNRDPDKNPTFYDANLIYAHYCSSDGWSGSSDERRPIEGSKEGWYFSGRLNVKAMLEILKEEYGLNQNDPETRVLFSGGSAGGTGVFVNADQVASMLPEVARDGRLKLINDGGWAHDFSHPGFRPGESNLPVREVFKNGYNFWSSSLNPFCEEAQKNQGRHPGLCLLGEVVYPYTAKEGLNLPTLVQTSSIDNSIMASIHGINPKEDKAAMEEWRKTLLDSLSEVDWVFSNGSHPYHTILDDDSKRTGWTMTSPDGTSFRELVTKFWEDGEPQRVIFGNP